jgi:molybdenum cofactor biosynthesis enzyme MoaA
MTERVGFYEVKGILLLRLMSRCNEKCVFCMVADEIAESDDVAYGEALARIEAQKPGTLIEFFGGEPTIYPRFLDLLTAARRLGHRCSIASNLRIFHSESFTRKVADLGASELYIRTSLYGDTAEVHDMYTAVPGTYVQTVRGIRNIVAADIDCQVNIVILKQNFERLEAITRQVAAWGVPRIKFGMLTSVLTCRDHAVSIGEVYPYLNRAIALAESLGLKTTVEKTPICVIDGRIDLISTEREIYGIDRIYRDDGECGTCLFRRWCDGLDPGYAEHFGTAGIANMQFVPARAITGSIENAQPELLRTYCVQIPDKSPDPETLNVLGRVLEQVLDRHGRLAVFPSYYVKEAGARAPEIKTA